MKLLAIILLVFVSARAFAAAQFDGISQYCKTDSTLDLSSSPKLAIAFWFKWPAYDSSGGTILSSTATPTSTAGSFFIIPNSFDGKFQIGLRGNVGMNQKSFTRPSANAWHLLVVNLDMSAASGASGEIVNVYIDGTLQTLGTLGVPANNTGNFANADVYLGSRGAGANFGAGTVDNLIIWSGVNLTSTEVSTLNNTRDISVPLTVEAASLKLDWKLNEVSGGNPMTGAGSVLDSSGNGNVGTPFDSPLGIDTVVYGGPFTYTAASSSQANVAAAVGQAFNGDTVIIPTGSNTWTTGISIVRGITLMGSGTNTDQTVIADAVSSGNVISVNVAAPQSVRLSNFRVECTTSGSVDPGAIPIIATTGTCTNYRVDHIFFNGSRRQSAAQQLRIFGALQGVVDHCWFNNTNRQSIYIQHQSWLGSSFGDGSWSDDTRHFQNDGIYIENCVFLNSNFADAVDQVGGSRLTFRFNTVTNAFIGGHGTETTQRTRGARKEDVYGNIFNWPAGSPNSPWDKLVYMRSGTGLVFSNTVMGSLNSGLVKAGIYRMWDGFPPWGPAGGTNPFDINDTTGGLGGDGLYIKATNNASTSATFIDTNQSWTNNTIVGYSVRNITRNTNWVQIVTANTSTSLTLTTSTASQNYNWQNGDVIEIRKVLKCLDQPAYGYTTNLLSGGSNASGNPPTPTSDPGQLLEPIYCWDNDISGASNPLFIVAPQNPIINGGVHYFTNTVWPSFTSIGQYPHWEVTNYYPRAFTFDSPADGATGVDPNNAILDWSDSANALSYDIYFDTSNPPALLTPGWTGGSSYLLFPLASATTYYVKIVANNLDGSSTSTPDPSSFTTSGSSPLNLNQSANPRRRRVNL